MQKLPQSQRVAENYLSLSLRDSLANLLVMHIDHCANG